MKKALSALLALIFVLSCIQLPVFAAEEEVVLYADNFDQSAEGEKPGVIGVVENTGKKLLVRVAKEGDNGYVYMRCEEGGTAGTPRMQFGFDATAYSTVTLTLKAKSMGVSAAAAYTADGNSTTLFGVNADKWTQIKVVLDFEHMTFSRWVDGELTGENKDLHMAEDATRSEIRFTSDTLEPGIGLCFDDIEIKAVPSKNPTAQKPADVPTEPPFAPTTAPKAVRVPTDAYTFLNTDFSEAKTGAATSAGVFDGGTAYSEVVDIDGNRMVRYWATDGKSHQPRLTFALPSGVDTYVIEYAFQMSEASESYVSLYSDGKSNASIAGTTSKNSAFTDGAWNYFHIEVDLKNLTAEVSLNDTQLSSKQINPIVNRESVSLWFAAGLKPGDVVYLDNVAVYTQEDYKFTGIIRGSREVVWENVLPSAPISEESYTSNLKAHPRIFVRDWDEMREKINASYETRMWYANLKKNADVYLTKDVAYTVNSRGNILESAREAEKHLQALAFVYKIEGDRSYLDKAYANMVAYGNWPDWSGFVSSLVTAEIQFGYACAYDWLYDDLTAEQKTAIRDIVKKHGLPEFIYNYERKTDSASYTAGEGNWNPVCNAAMIGTAFAFADEEPNLAEYILERAPGFIVNALKPYAPHGAYPEGTTYWAYGTQFLCYDMDMLEHGFKDGFALPEAWKYYNYPGVADTVEFAIYNNGTAGKFDYGDSDSYLTSSEVFYWMANRFDKPQYAWYQNKLQADRNGYLGGVNAILALSCYDENNASVVPGAFALDKFYDADTGYNGMSMRSTWEGNDALFAAMQGGENSASHMHLSLGTYVIDYHGQRFVDEEIITDYALQNPAEEIYYKRAEAHNTLVVNPSKAADQKKDAVARLIRHGASANTAFGILDMTGTNAAYTDAKRGMMLTDNRNRVIIQDEIKTAAPSEVYWFANTQANVKIAPDGRSAVLESAGEKMLLRMVQAPADARFEIMDRVSVVEGVLNTQEGKKLAVHMQNVTDLQFAVEYIGLEDGEGVPAPNVYVPLSVWTAEPSGESAVMQAGGATVLKIGTPNAIAMGEKTFVDTNNCEVVPFTENGRTLVPVRFISESFGATVGWDDATQTVSVHYKDTEIKLVIGSNQMLVNGQAVVLDVPANTYNSRTLIPLRALVEALGKYVFWDDRGLIVIKDDATPFDAQTVNNLIAELDIRVTVNGQDLTFFTLDRTQYSVLTDGAQVPTVGAYSLGEDSVSVMQAAALNEAAIITVNGKTYTIRFSEDTFKNILGHRDPGVVSELSVSIADKNLPSYDTFIYVEDLTDSTDFATYPKRGIVDGIINSETKNRWACNGEGWIQMDFGSVKNVYSMAFSGVSQDVRAYNFDVLASVDGINYTTVHTGGAPTTTDKMSIIPLGDIAARYIKLVCHGSNQSTWNTYAEVRFYESAAQQAEDVSYWQAYFSDSAIQGSVGTVSNILVRAADVQRSSVTLRADAQYTYKIENEAVATVSPDGTISFVGPGKTVLTVIVTQDGYSARATVPVECK